MPRIKTEQLKAGMILTDRVKSADNVVLLPSGCVLSERHLELLSGWGIGEVEVEVPERLAATVALAASEP